MRMVRVWRRQGLSIRKVPYDNGGGLVYIPLADTLPPHIKAGEPVRERWQKKALLNWEG